MKISTSIVKKKRNQGKHICILNPKKKKKKELDKQEVMLDKIEKKVDKATVQLDTMNTKLKKQLDKVMFYSLRGERKKRINKTIERTDERITKTKIRSALPS